MTKRHCAPAAPFARKYKPLPLTHEAEWSCSKHDCDPQHPIAVSLDEVRVFLDGNAEVVHATGSRSPCVAGCHPAYSTTAPSNATTRTCTRFRAQGHGRLHLPAGAGDTADLTVASGSTHRGSARAASSAVLSPLHRGRRARWLHSISCTASSLGWPRASWPRPFRSKYGDILRGAWRKETRW